MIGNFSEHILENHHMNRSHCRFVMLNGLKLSNLVIYVDGTTNFAHGYPSFAVSVGVLFQGNPAAAAVVLMKLNFFLKDNEVKQKSLKIEQLKKKGKLTIYVLFLGGVCWWSYGLEHAHIFCNCWYERELVIFFI